MAVGMWPWALGSRSRAASLWCLSRPTDEKLLLSAILWGQSFPYRSRFFSNLWAQLHYFEDWCADHGH